MRYYYFVGALKMPLSADQRNDLGFRLSQVFKPGTPINREDLFAGRKRQIRDVVDAINQNGQHVILYGERGVGKTSLANMIAVNLRSPITPVIAAHINCNSGDAFGDVWRTVFTEVKAIVEKKHVALPAALKRKVTSASEGNPAMGPDHVRRLLGEIGEHSILVPILDEFDTLTDSSVRRLIADTIKYLSDRNVPATVVIVGVSDDVDGLITEHHSIERCISQVKMPRMSRDELEQIVTNSLLFAEMTIERPALHEISRLSKGLPHYAHLLGLESGRQALDSQTTTVSQAHLAPAIRAAIEKAQLTIQSAYHKATLTSRKDALYDEVLLACAMAETDDLEYFSPSDVRPPLERILKREYKVEAFARHLHAFCTDERGPLLKKLDSTGRPRFRFVNPLMQPFVLIKGMADSALTDDDLRATRDKNDPQGRLF
jgi:Cdc6-like AAA superfamily ATPase